MQKHRTAELAARRLRASGLEDVNTEIGKTGVVGILRNDNGPTVMLRADMDALPVHENTGLPYASCMCSNTRTIFLSYDFPKSNVRIIGMR
jgi:hippurate hydrolase